MKKNCGKTSLTFLWLRSLFYFSFMTVAVGTLMIKGLPQIGKALAAPEIQFAIRLSLYTSLISTAFCIVIAIPVAYVLARVDIPMKSFFNTLLDLPLALPPVVSGLCLLIIFGTTAFGAWLEEIDLSFVFTVKGSLWLKYLSIPFMIRVMKSTILSVNPRLEFIADPGMHAGPGFLENNPAAFENGI